jgi:hypothetical protein
MAHIMSAQVESLKPRKVTMMVNRVANGAGKKEEIDLNKRVRAATGSVVEPPRRKQSKVQPLSPVSDAVANSR